MCSQMVPLKYGITNKKNLHSFLNFFIYLLFFFFVFFQVGFFKLNQHLEHANLIEFLVFSYDHVCMCRVIVTWLVSAAGTGYFYTIKKPRIKPKMTLRKYDPVGEQLAQMMFNNVLNYT